LQGIDQRYNNLFMQPIESIETISHSSNSNSKNIRRQTKGLTQGFVCRSSESPPDLYVSVEVA
jgi:hypothetical protein